MEAKPLCFVLMPFGRKSDPTGGPDIDFDRVYSEAILPAIEAAGMEAVRADEEVTGGIIHKAMFERLLLCEYAVADMTTANANVFYELGVRHTARPRTTQAIFATSQPIPFDVNFLRALPYELGEGNSFGEQEASALKNALTERLLSLRELTAESDAIDSPLFQLLGDWKTEIAHIKTDVFRDQVRIKEGFRKKMVEVRRMGAGGGGLDALKEIQDRIGPLDVHEAGVVIDLMLSYRALEGWSEMVALYDRMPLALQRQVLVREQLAFALNRRAGTADRDRAIELLEKVEEEAGANPETCGLLGRIHKDLWDKSRTSSPVEARGHLRKAIDTYRRGFESDWRDAYPGVNLVTLLDIRGDDSDIEERDRLLPVVLYSVTRRLSHAAPDYWDHATLLELAVLSGAADEAQRRLEDALGATRESWECGTTARNLGLIGEARGERGEDVEMVGGIIEGLKEKEATLKRGALQG